MDEACLHAPTRKTSKPHGSVKEKKRRAIHCTPVWPLAELRLGVRIPSEPTAALLAINIRAHVHARVYTHRQKKHTRGLTRGRDTTGNTTRDEPSATDSGTDWDSVTDWEGWTINHHDAQQYGGITRNAAGKQPTVNEYTLHESISVVKTLTKVETRKRAIT